MTFKPETLNQLLNAFNEPAILMDREYVIVASNKAYRDRYIEAHKRKKVLRCYEASHHYKKPCDQEGESCPLKRCLVNKTVERDLHLHHTNQGEEHVDVELTPIFDDDGEVQYFLEKLHHIDNASTSPKADGLVGKSPSFQKLLHMIQRVAKSDASVLLLGESGTGKELVAKAVHDASARCNKPFVPVDCSGLTESLFESELFGYEKGAFTGAKNQTIGLVESARGGTLFLDETGDIPFPLQVKLLRLLETRVYRRVGGVELIKADFRLISATHKNIINMVDEKAFRQDLYYRINTFPIQLPSLKERVEDLPLLIESLFSRIDANEKITITDKALKCLQQYDYPGNIRELYNIIQRAALLSDDNVIDEQHLPEECSHRSTTAAQPFQHIVPLRLVEEDYLRWVQKHFKGDNRALAEKLGVSERTLYRKISSLPEDLSGPMG